MAKPPKLTALSQDLMPDAPAWFTKLLPSLNSFFADTVNALTHNLNRTDNLQSQVFTATINVGPSVNATFPYKFRNGLSAKPVDVRIGQIIPTTSGASISSPVDCSWWELNSKGEIQINYISGLSANTNYQVTFIVE